jgi:8-oxo-dGTP pyrophosphatase MutT (NUDIX family)
MRTVWDHLVIQSEAPPAGDLPRAAVLAALYEDAAGDVRVILTKRPDTMPTHAGHLAFPGGRPDPGDAGPVETALREADEEVGIDPAAVEVLGFLPTIHTVEFSLLVVPVVGRLAGEPVLRPSPREVDKVLTPRLVDLADETRWRSEVWRGHTIWFYEIDDEILWGATARMTRNLLGLA